MEYSLVELCIGGITIAFVWLVIIITPTIWRLKKSMGQISEAARAIETMAEEIKPVLIKMDNTFDSVGQIISSFKGEMEKIEQVTAKFKGLADLIVDVAANPLVKALSLAAGIAKGISVVSSKIKRKEG